jgi:hypothetical protein
MCIDILAQHDDKYVPKLKLRAYWKSATGVEDDGSSRGIAVYAYPK